MTRYHNINGKKIAYTSKEELARDAEEKKAAEESAAVKHQMDRVYYGTKIYPELTEQLDQLFRDVAAGKFGADAQTGEWYIAIKEVKDTNPKPS